MKTGHTVDNTVHDNSRKIKRFIKNIIVIEIV